MYVKWFDTVMFYYVILVYFSVFSECGHCRGRSRGDIVGAKDKVSEKEIPEQRCRVFPSVLLQGHHGSEGQGK
ncbi:unnamed protein product [Staurois parvus]|uniref:Secreted protein n=1 Tax=Staurois parvus TaxID=386267 RepID=A0ABN9B5G0_9NEOB|nr:unnamed protein product [Staurois parvus]